MDFKSDYFLKVAALGQFPEMEISENDYNEIVNARQTLTTALSIEEKYDLVLGNFLDLEKELLMLTVEKVVDHRFDYSRAYAVTSSLNRRVVNFVLSGKNYTELIASKASKCTGNDKEVEVSVKALTSKHYDESLDYRLMEALRNHLSHSGVAVHLVDNPDKWLLDDKKQATNLVFNIDIYALKSRLAENTGFKLSVLKELPDRIDLKKSTRSYLGAISSIQEEVRKITINTVENSRSVIEKHLKKYAELNSGSSFAVGAYSAASHKLGLKPVMLLLDWDDIRIELSEKNQSTSNMEKRYVSSAITKQ
jgi:plasmid maintenance system antidote protein VapI